MKKNEKILIVGVATGIVIIIALVIALFVSCSNRPEKSGKDGTTVRSAEGKKSEDDKQKESGQKESRDSKESGKKEDGKEGEKEPSNEGGSHAGISHDLNVAEGLSADASEYEGKKGTGDFNYGEALQKSLLFYELQRSGDLSGCELRTNWRGSSCLEDGSDVGLDLTGGLFDAGDNVKFNLPMGYTSSVLAWGVYEYPEAYEESGQKEYALGTIRWVCDYLMKCHPEDDVFYYQVGDGGQDHGWWGPCETMHMDRKSSKVTVDSPGSCVVGEAAAALASAAVVFKDSDPDYAELCIRHAKQLYDFAARTRSDAGYTMANGFYTSFSGFEDELAWSAAWLYLATGDSGYLEKAEKSMATLKYDPKWAMCWDDVSVGALALLCEQTGKRNYADMLEQNLDFWTRGMSDGSRVTYSPKGLAWLDSWGSLRYATTESFVALVYSKSDLCGSEEKKIYTEFAESQVNYALGSTGRSFVVGFGENPPVNVHHRTAHSSATNNINEPKDSRHILFGALVGGPDASDNYSDERNNYTTNEVADDYNAGFTGALAGLYARYGGQTLKNFGAVEKITADEAYVQAGINVDGEEFVEIKAYVVNTTSWPARTLKKAELRYFVDLSELYDNGGCAKDVEVSGNYTQGGAVNPVLQIWDEEKHIYYASVDFSGTDIYPGGQETYRKEVQFRIRNTGANRVWDDTNDFSFRDIAATMGSTVTTDAIALYEDGERIWGSEPDGEAGGPAKDSPSKEASKEPANEPTGTGEPTGTKESSGNGSGNGKNSLQAKGSNTQNGLTLCVEHTTTGTSANSISMNLSLRNESSEDIDLNGLKVYYYFSEDAQATWTFACYYSAVNSAAGGNRSITESVRGDFADGGAGDKGADKCCVISLSGDSKLEQGDELVLNVCINRTDWQNFNVANDYSGEDAANIVVMSGDKVLMGTRP